MRNPQTHGAPDLVAFPGIPWSEAGRQGAAPPYPPCEQAALLTHLGLLSPPVYTGSTWLPVKAGPAGAQACCTTTEP